MKSLEGIKGREKIEDVLRIIRDPNAPFQMRSEMIQWLEGAWRFYKTENTRKELAADLLEEIKKAKNLLYAN